jgi:uncharacterized membrane protein
MVLLSIANATVAAQPSFEIESTNLLVYRDGLVHVRQALLPNELAPKLTLSLVSSSIENVIVLDENQISVDYEITAGNLTIFTLGAERVVVEYDTIALTTKEAEVWTLFVDNSYDATVFLPQNSTIIYLSKMPTAIDTTGTGITLSLHPDQWEISYILPLLPDEPTKDDDSSFPAVPIAYLIAIIVAGIAITLSTILVFRRKSRPNVKKILRAHPQLKKEDREVLQFVAERGGKAFEAEIRQRFPDMPRTSLWRLVRRLERLEIIEVKKIGLENQVELK